MLKVIQNIVVCLFLCSCSSLERFGKVETFTYKEILFNNGVREMVVKSFQYVKNSSINCFEEGTKGEGDIITVKNDEVGIATRQLYYPENGIETWYVKKTPTKNSNQFKMIAYPEEKTSYLIREVESCYFKFAGIHSDAYQYYTSFRIISPIGEK